MEVHRNVLKLPEILQNIFTWLVLDPPSLLAVIQVNKTWFLNGVAILWQKADTEKLARISKERRQIYAPYIRELIFNGSGDEESYISFQDLAFTNLRQVSIDAYQPRKGHPLDIRPFLPPTLEKFSLYGGGLSLEVLDHLQINCRRLRWVLIDSPGTYITPTAFLNFLRSHLALESLTFIVNMEHLLPLETMLHLASCNSLRRLEACVVINEELLDQIIATTEAPFPVIERLMSPVTAAAIPPLVALLHPVHTLRELSFSIDGPGQNILTYISRLTNLHHLDIKFRQAIDLSTEDLSALKQLTLLKWLEIGPDQMHNDPTIQAMDWTDADLETLVSSIPRLKHLSLQVQCPLSIAALASLSHHCRFLELCEMLPILDFQMPWQFHDEIWFPNLKELSVGGFDDTSDDPNLQIKPDQLAITLRTRCPRLQELYASSEDAYTVSVLSEFGQ